MRITETAVVVFVLSATMCRSEIVIATPSRDESDPNFSNDLAELVATCYGDRIEVGLIGVIEDDLPRTLSTRHLIPVVLMDSSPMKTQRRKTEFHRKLRVFIADVVSVEHFDFIMQEKLQFTIWWNHMASIFILDHTIGCQWALSYLDVAWASNLLNAKVMCDHPEDGRVILTVNPFTSEAPTPWSPKFNVTGSRNHPLTLLFRQHRRNASMCANLDFDKSEDLGGYPIAVLGSPPGHEDRHNQALTRQKFWRKLNRIFDTMSRSLNVNMVYIDSVLHFDVLKDIVASNYAPETIEMFYPFEQTGLVIITQFRGHKSQLNKILFVIDVDSRIGLGIVYLITLIFFKLIVRQAFVPACLNLVRITCNTGFTNIPDFNACRVYLTSLLFFVITMQGIYQGNLAALLTQSIPLRQINTMQDLADFGYEVYGHSACLNLVEHRRLRERYTVVEEYDNCLAYAINDPSAACIWTAKAGVLDLAREFNLHVTSEPIELVYMSIGTRLDWPLQQKADVIMSKMVEADVLEVWSDKCNPTELSDFEIDAEVRKNTDFKIMELGELAFSFVILAVGLLCATVTFAVECAMQYRCIFVDRHTN